eukprot:1158790-Pelagomonas_calceolata.AAC.20
MTRVHKLEMRMSVKLVVEQSRLQHHALPSSAVLQLVIAIPSVQCMQASSTIRKTSLPFPACYNLKDFIACHSLHAACPQPALSSLHGQARGFEAVHSANFQVLECQCQYPAVPLTIILNPQSVMALQGRSKLWTLKWSD